MEEECTWKWLGVQPWYRLADTCVSPATCVAPLGDGNFYGETRVTQCSDHTGGG